MRSVDQFRAEYSRTGHVSAEPDASYRFPISSHSPMTLAFNRVNDFAAAMAQDLQQVDRNHAVSFFQLFFMFSSNRETFLPVGARKRTHWV